MAKDFIVRAGLADNPALAAELGELSVAWSSIEFAVYKIFEILTDLPPPLARAIFYSQRTTAARLDLARAVAAIVLRKRGKRNRFGHVVQLGRPLALQRTLTTLLGEVGNLAGSRNKYIHDPWVGYETGPRAFQLRLTGKEIHSHFESIRVRDLDRLTRKLQKKADVLARLTEILPARVRPLLDILDLQHELTLVPATKSTLPKSRKATPTHRLRPYLE